MKEIIVYTLTDPRDGLVKYVGITSRPTRRMVDHLNDKRNNLKSTWVKSLKKLGLKPLFDVIDITDKENYSKIEQYWISQMKTWGFPLKNMTDGGDGSYGVKPWNKGLKGVFKHSEESKQKMSKFRKENTLGENNGFFGKQHSDKTIEKARERMLGSKWNETQYEKLGGVNHPSRKPVFCYDLDGNFIKKYDAAVDASKDGFDPHAISKVCRGVSKSHKSHIFTLIEK